MTNNLTSLVVEVTNICNLRCKMCPKQTDAIYKEYEKSNERVMCVQLFKKIIDEYSVMDTGVQEKSLILQFMGESLTMPNFLDYCAYANNKKIKFGFTTNAMLLTEDITNKLLAMPYFSNIAVSIDAYTELLEKIRVRSKRDTVYNNLNYFIQQNKQNAYKRKIIVNAVILKENKNEIDDVVGYWLNQGVDFISACYPSDNNIIPTKINFMGERVACPLPNYMLIILTTGKLVACCRDSHYELDLGNVKEKTLSELWNGEKYNKLRTLQKEGKWNTISPCNNCLSWICGSIPEKEVESNLPNINKFEGSFWYRWERS